MIPFGEYRPDLSDYESPTERDVQNVVPRADGYGPFPSLAALSASLGQQCFGGFAAYKTDGSVLVFAGTLTDLWLMNNTTFAWSKVSPVLATPVNAAFSTATTGGSLAPGTYYYRVSATNAQGETLASTETSQVVPAGTSTNTVTVNWGAVSGATGYKVYGRTSGAELLIAAVGGVTTYTDTGAITPSGALPATNTASIPYSALSAGDLWQFRQFNSLVFATQANVLLQLFDLTSSSTFGNAPGNPPQARYMDVVGKFLVLAGLLSNPNRVQWSGLNDVNSSQSWTPGVNSSDLQDLADGGFCRGIAGGESGIIVQDTIVRRMTYLPGDPRVFQIEKIAEELGIYGPYSLVRSGSTVFFYSLKGFHRIDPGGVPVQIGRERVDRTFFADFDASQPGLFQGVADPRSSRILWAYKSVNGSTGLFDKLLCYDAVLDKFTPIKTSGELLFKISQPGITLEGLATLFPNLDAMTQSLDSFQSIVAPELAAFDSSHKVNFFRGPNLEAILETSEQGTDGRRVKMKKGFRPISDAPSVFGSFSKRENLQTPAVYGAENPINPVTGIIPTLLDARYSRIKCRIPAGQSWTYISGVEPADLAATGKR